MNPFWNKRTAELSPYIPGEQPKDRVFIKLNTNENPFPPSADAMNAIRKVPGDSLRLYPDPVCLAFREAVAKAFNVKPEQVFPANGSDEALAFIFGSLFESGGPPVLFPDITYSFYPVYANLWGVPYRAVPLADDFSVVVGDYLVPSGGVVLANPNAPTGRVLPAADVLRIASYLEKTYADSEKKPILLVDEAYAPFAGESVVPFLEGHPGPTSSS